MIVRKYCKRINFSILLAEILTSKVTSEKIDYGYKHYRRNLVIVLKLQVFKIAIKN